MGPKLHTDGTLSALREHAIQNSKRCVLIWAPSKLIIVNGAQTWSEATLAQHAAQTLYRWNSCAICLREHNIPSSAKRLVQRSLELILIWSLDGAQASYRWNAMCFRRAPRLDTDEMIAQHALRENNIMGSSRCLVQRSLERRSTVCWFELH